MNRRPNVVGPRLEALLDQRDHIRIKISLAEEEGGMELALLRQRLAELDHMILKQWSDLGG
jgi:hypothetical protein